MDRIYVKDLKKAYRILRKEKNQYEPGDEKRVELGRKMKELKVKIEKETGGKVDDPQKQELIEKIQEIYKTSRDSVPDNLGKFTYEELEFHYLKRTGKVANKDEYRKLKGIKEETPATETLVHPFSVSNSKYKKEDSKSEKVVDEIGDAAHSPMEVVARSIRRKTSY